MKKKSIFLIVGIVLILVVVLYYDLKSDAGSDISKMEHIISIRSNDKKVEASTGSFCYKNGSCLDKIDFQEFKYDVIKSYYDNSFRL